MSFHGGPDDPFETVRRRLRTRAGRIRGLDGDCLLYTLHDVIIDEGFPMLEAFGNNTNSPWVMPEIEWYYGYPFVWLVIMLLAGGMLIAFKRHGWW